MGYTDLQKQIAYAYFRWREIADKAFKDNNGSAQVRASVQARMCAEWFAEESGLDSSDAAVKIMRQMKRVGVI